MGGCLVARGRITLGTLVAFLSYMGSLFEPVQGHIVFNHVNFA